MISSQITYVICAPCGGSGKRLPDLRWEEASDDVCRHCKGFGRIKQRLSLYYADEELS